MKFRIGATLFVLLVLFVLYVLSSDNTGETTTEEIPAGLSN